MSAEHDDDLRHRQYRRLLDTFGIPEERRTGWLLEMADAFEPYPVPAIVRATDRYVRSVTLPPGQYHEVPTPGTFAEYVYRAMEQLEAERDGERTPSDGHALPRQEQKALPGPSRWAEMTGPERADFLEIRLALGKLRGRAGASVTSFDGSLLPFDLGDSRVQDVIDEMRRTGFCQSTLDRIRSGEVVSPQEFIAASAAGRPMPGRRPVR